MALKLPRPALTLPALLLLWLLAILAAPPERTLGTIIRWVFAHAALTQAALLLFLVAAILAALYLLGRDRLYDWFEITGWVALGLWLAGFLLSTFPAKFSWGVWIDFDEPRTQMTLRVLAVGIGFLLLTRWIDSRPFTAAAQIAFSLAVLFLNRSTAIVRHPLNPIGQADNPAIPLTYSLIFLITLLIGAYLIFHLTSRRLAQTPD